LNREYIDIYHLHQVHGAQDLADRRPVIDFLLELKEQGLVRAIGASVHKVEAARAVVAESDIDVLGPMLNSHGLGIIDGSIDDMVEVCSQVDTRGMGIYARCGGCEACVETCAQEALYLDRSQADESKGKKGQSVVNMDKCILCGYCAEVCPKFLIRVI